VFVVSFLFWTFTANDSPSGVDHPEFGWVVTGLLGMTISATLAFRAWRLGVYLEDRQLVVRNMFSTRRLSADEVVKVEMGKWPILQAPVPVMHLLSGRSIRLTGIEPPNRGTRPSNREAPRAIDTLNDWLADATGTSD
jgi:hypothetical protein